MRIGGGGSYHATRQADVVGGSEATRMYRRYTIHRDGDLLVEDLDPTGKPIEPEAVPVEDRLPCEVVLLSPDDQVGRERLIELLEAALEMEQGDTSGWNRKPPGGGGKLPVLG